MKLAVKQLDPAIVKSVRRIIDNPEKAEHPVYDVSRALGTGKATCRACDQPIRENERSILFWHAPHDKDHEHHYRRVRMVIHEDDCATAKSNVKCPVCRELIPENGWKKHWQNHEIATGWKLLGSTFVCAKHLEAHCGQCDEDRKLEEPALDPRVVKIPTKHKKKKASEWRHENNDGFEMWETKEDHNRFAIVKTDGKFDLYELQGTFNSPEEAKSAAEGMKKTAQDGGGGGGGGGGASGGGSGGGDGGSSGGDGGGTAGASADGGGEASGDSGFSSGSENSESNESSGDVETKDGDEDPRPPSDNPHENPERCPTCDERLNPIYIGSGVFYSCWKCGFTSRTKKKRREIQTEAAWIDRLDRAHRAEPEEGSVEILDISPRVAPVMLDEPGLPPSEPKPATDLF